MTDAARLFGAAPFKRAWYGNILDDPRLDADMRVLIGILRKLKTGLFSEVNEMVPFLSHPDFDVRQYSHQLFADTCSHDQVHYFKSALETAPDLSEIHRVILRLGQTLSLAAIPLILAARHELDDPETDGYVCGALRNIFPLEGIDEFNIAEEDVLSIFQEAAAGLDQGAYYYRGKPVFVGDITKELINSAAVAHKEGRGLVVVLQAQLLADFSGKPCPVDYGDSITDTKIRVIFDYVRALAEMDWRPGKKYFFGHILK